MQTESTIMHDIQHRVFSARSGKHIELLMYTQKRIMHAPRRFLFSARKWCGNGAHRSSVMSTRAQIWRQQTFCVNILISTWSPAQTAKYYRPEKHTGGKTSAARTFSTKDAKTGKTYRRITFVLFEIILFLLCLGWDYFRWWMAKKA